MEENISQEETSQEAEKLKIIFSSQRKQVESILPTIALQQSWGNASFCWKLLSFLPPQAPSTRLMTVLMLLLVCSNLTAELNQQKAEPLRDQEVYYCFTSLN